MRSAVIDLHPDLQVKRQDDQYVVYRVKRSKRMLNDQLVWFAAVHPARNSAGLLSPRAGYVVTLGSFDSVAHFATLDQALTHVVALHNLEP